MRINIYHGTRTLSQLQGSIYLHPTFKLQPYQTGFELVLWFIRSYVSIRVVWKR